MKMGECSDVDFEVFAQRLSGLNRLGKSGTGKDDKETTATDLNNDDDGDSVLHAAIKLSDILERSDQTSNDSEERFLRAKAEAEAKVREFEAFSKFREEEYKAAIAQRPMSASRPRLDSLKRITTFRRTPSKPTTFTRESDTAMLTAAFKAVKFKGAGDDYVDVPTVKLLIGLWAEMLANGEVSAAPEGAQTVVVIRQPLCELSSVNDFRELVKQDANRAFTTEVVNVAKKRSADEIHGLFMKAKYSY